MDPEPTDREPAAEKARSIGALSTVGLAFVFAILLGALLGYLLDNWFGTGPLFFLVFFVIGFAAGALNVYRTATRFIK